MLRRVVSTNPRRVIARLSCGHVQELNGQHEGQQLWCEECGKVAPRCWRCSSVLERRDILNGRNCCLAC